MSYLADELERQLNEQGITGVQLADRTGISTSQIYNWLKSAQVTISEKQLTSIQAALTKDSHAHARLVLAHLLDEKFGHGHDRIAIEMKSEYELKDHPRTKARGEKALHFLAELRLKSKDCNDLLVDLARVLGADV